jgi:RNA polymerase sigma-70 factor (ECF subfamily)
MNRTGDVEGKTRQFASLLTHKTTIFYICLGYCREPVDAEDLTQEVYLRAYSNLPSLKHPDLKKEWLCRIARNVCLNFLHRSKRNPVSAPLLQAASHSGTPETAASEIQELNLIKETVARLPRKLREVFVLREYGELSYREIALSLGIREGTVMSRLNRARQNILKNMREHFDGSGNRSEENK